MSEPSSPRIDSELLKILYEVKTEVVAIRQRQDEDHDRLFGNGRPGELEELDKRVKAIELKDAKAEGETSSNRRWSAVIATGVSGLLTWLIETLVHRKP